jgi:hypothetical protein
MSIREGSMQSRTWDWCGMSQRLRSCWRPRPKRWGKATTGYYQFKTEILPVYDYGSILVQVDVVLGGEVVRMFHSVQVILGVIATIQSDRGHVFTHNRSGQCDFPAIRAFSF